MRLVSRGPTFDTAERVLAHAVPGHDPDAKALLQLVPLLGGRSGRRIDGSQLRFHPGIGRLGGQHLEHGANDIDGGHLELARILPEGRGVELRCEGHRKTVDQ